MIMAKQKRRSSKPAKKARRKITSAQAIREIETALGSPGIFSRSAFARRQDF